MSLRHPTGSIFLRTFLLVLFIALSCPVSAEPIDSADIRVIDGDTIRVYHEQPNVRLVGFNAPETRQAACDAERQLARSQGDATTSRSGAGR
jgi:endonuclease YncB( thermonuclease family)